MSDAHHEHDGGHELENLDTGNLMKLVTALIVVVLISIGAVSQWFYRQRAELIAERGGPENKIQLSRYNAQMDERLGCDRSFVAWRRCPGDSAVNAAAVKIAKNPELLRAGKRPAKFQEPETMYAPGIDPAATMGGATRPAQPGLPPGAKLVPAPVPGDREPPVMAADGAKGEAAGKAAGKSDEPAAPAAEKVDGE